MWSPARWSEPRRRQHQRSQMEPGRTNLFRRDGIQLESFTTIGACGIPQDLATNLVVRRDQAAFGEPQP